MRLKNGATLRWLMAVCAVASVQTLPAQNVNGRPSPASPVSAEQGELDGKCRAVKPGDVVHFTLHVDGVSTAHAVYANLQMKLGKAYAMRSSSLPLPGFDHLDGGGHASPDASQGNVYHFAFTVPHEVTSGMYHGAGVYVTAAMNDDFAQEGARHVPVTSRTMKEIRHYCLIVASPFAARNRTRVTNFQEGPVERKVAQPLPSAAASPRIYLPTQ